jgi:acyl-CoA thioesterase
MTADTPAPTDDLQASLGLQRRVSVEGGRAILEYLAGAHMCHSGGVVQGGFVCGWIDAAMAHAVIAETGGEVTPMSLELKVSFFAPARPGLVIAEGWIERRGRSTAFLEGRLTNAAGEVLAKGSSTARLMPRAQVEASARRAVE